MNHERHDVVAEFLVERHENLSRLDREPVELEKNPGDRTLQTIAHNAATLLSQLRDRRRPLDPALISLILETADATLKALLSIEAGEDEVSDTSEVECDLADAHSFAGCFLEMERPLTVDDWVRDIRGQLANYDRQGW